MNVGTGQEFTTVTAALDALPAGEVAVVVLHAQVVDEPVLIDEERVVLVRAVAEVEDPDWQLESVYQYELGGLIAVRAATLYLDGVQISARANNPGVVLGVYDGAVFVEGGYVRGYALHQYGMAVGVRAQRSTVSIVDAALEIGGGTPEGIRRGIELSESSTLHFIRSQVDSHFDAVYVDGAFANIRNSFVLGDAHAISGVNGAIVDLVYNTLGSAMADDSGTIVCDETSSISVQNSIVVKAAGNGSPLDCIAATTTSILVDAVQFDSLWFEDFSAGDFHLRREHPFADVAVWREGDPVTDIDGQARPDTAGAPDVAGADVR